MASRTPTPERATGRTRPVLRPAPIRTNRPSSERPGRPTEARPAAASSPGARPAASGGVRRPSLGRQSTGGLRDYRSERRGFSLGFNDQMTRAEREHVKARLAFLSLSGILAFALLLVIGTLTYDKVYLAQRPMLRVDGNATSLQAFANLVSYEKNRLELEMIQAQQFASSPAQPGTDPSQNFLAQYGQQRMSQIQSQLATLSVAVPENIVEEQLVRQEAAERSLTVSAEDVEKELKLIVGYQDPNAAATPEPAVTPGPDETAQPTAAPTVAPTATARRARQSDTFEALYKEYQRITGGTDGVIRGQVEYQLLRRKLVEELGKSVPTTGEQAHARHILVADEAIAQNTVERLNAGESFEALAAELSNDTSNNTTGGDLGWFGKGAMVKEFEDAVFSLPVGQISAPVKTSFGYHIIRVDERDANRPLEGQALETEKSKAYSTWLEAEKNSHQIERLIDGDMIDWAERNGRRPQTGRR